jgi:hypothetical protein
MYFTDRPSLTSSSIGFAFITWINFMVCIICHLSDIQDIQLGLSIYLLSSWLLRAVSVDVRLSFFFLVFSADAVSYFFLFFLSTQFEVWLAILELGEGWWLPILGLLQFLDQIFTIDSWVFSLLNAKLREGVVVLNSHNIFVILQSQNSLNDDWVLAI